MMLRNKLEQHGPAALIAAVISAAVTGYGIWSSGETARMGSFAESSRMLVECQRIVREMQQDERSGAFAGAEPIKEAYRVLLDTVPFVAWVKRFDAESGTFRMWLINERYSATYGIARHEYEGKTDAEAWGSDSIAVAYSKNDYLALRNRGCITGYEPDSRQGATSFAPVTKCYMALGHNDFVVGFAGAK